MRGQLASLVAVSVGVAACSGASTPTAPTPTATPPPVIVVPVSEQPAVTQSFVPAGTWSGSIRDAISGDGSLQLTLVDRALNQQSGTWSAAFTNGERLSGIVIGAMAPTGYGILMISETALPCAAPPVTLALINMVVTSNHLNAVVGRSTCSVVAFGTVTLSKQ